MAKGADFYKLFCRYIYCGGWVGARLRYGPESRGRQYLNLSENNFIV